MAQLDKASDYESEDWGFESLQGLTFLFLAVAERHGPARTGLHSHTGFQAVYQAPVV